MSRQVVKDSTDASEYIVIKDSVTGIPEIGFDVTTLDFQYTRNGAAPSVKADVTALAATDSDHTDNSAIEIDATNSPGLCRVDFPDAAFADGVDSVILSITGAGFDPIHKEIELVDAPATAAALATVDTNVNSILAQTLLGDKWKKNRIAFSGNSMILYDDDNVTPLLTWVLSQGSLSVSGPYNRAKAT